MSTKAWIIFIIVCVLSFGGLLIWSQRDKIDVSKIDTNAILSRDKLSGDIADHVDGKADSKVVLVEYGDFQCPGCGAAHPRVKALMDKYGTDIAFVFRNFPLTNIHPNARAAAAAAEAAGLNGKYWEMHNLLFETQDQWSDATTENRTQLFKSYARQIGLDSAVFERTLEEESVRINQKISFDQAIGRKLELTGTPSFFLNGKKLEESQISSDEAFEKLITDAMAQEGIKPAATAETEAKQ